jgi:hypothetical protein
MPSKIALKEVLLILLISLIFRYLFASLSGINIDENGDWWRYDLQSDNILSGNFNLKTDLFIPAPLYSYFVAGMKYIFDGNYGISIVIFQIILSSISAVYLMKTAEVIFNNYKVSLLSGFIYAIYPITIYFTHILGQEAIFQSVFIISVYYIAKFINSKKNRDLILFALCFSIALLTKSHILLILPFFIISILIAHGGNKVSYYRISKIFGVIFLMTLPYGVYNKVTNDVYVISSTGHGGFFLTGHNDDFYEYVVTPPPLGSARHTELKNMNFKVFRELKPVEGELHKELQLRYLKEGLQWVYNNPDKFIKLSWKNLINFLSPGFNVNHHEFYKWLLALIISTPVFILAYAEIVRKSISNFKQHLPIVSIFLGMLGFSLVFYAQNRFRVVTLEPFYLIYASSMAVYIASYFRKNKF